MLKLRLLFLLVLLFAVATVSAHVLDSSVPLPPVSISLQSSPSKGKLTVLVTTSGLYSQGSPLRGTVTLTGQSDVHVIRAKNPRDQRLPPRLWAKSRPIVFSEDKGVAVFRIRDLPRSDYAVLALAVMPDGRSVSASTRFSYAGPVPASYSKLGYQPEVPAPWTLVVAQGEQVQVWNRTVTFGGNGLPSEITSAGLKALRQPIVVRAHAKGVELNGKTGLASVKRVAAGAAVASGSTCFQDLSIKTTSRTEFDGCIRVDMYLKAGKSSPDSLVLDVPLDKTFAELMHANVLDYEPTWSGSIPAGTGTVWSQEFVPIIWIGNTRAGLCWFGESKRDWALAPASAKVKYTQEIVRTDDGVNLRIHLARTQFPVGKMRHIVFGLQPTPTKPIPADWRLTRMGAGNPFLEDSLRRDSIIFEQGCRWWGWPEPFSWDEYNHRMEQIKSGAITVREDHMPLSPKVIEDARTLIRSNGGHFLWYTPMQVLGNTSPWFSTYGREWKLSYGFGYDMIDDPQYNSSPVCPVSKWQDLHVGSVESGLDKDLYDGIYIDLFYPWKCDNALHGCGYIDDDGRRQGEYRIWSMRDEMKRLYRVVHTRKNGYILGHISASFCPPIHGFLDAAVNGEQYQTYFTVRDGVDYHDVLSLDKCRAEVSGRQWGWMPVWLPQFWAKVARPTSRQMLSLILLHDCLVWPAYMDSGEYHLANATLTTLGYVNSEFVGYYDTKPLAKADSPSLYVSGYKNLNGKPGSAVLIITNHGLTDGTFRVTPSVSALGLAPAGWSAAVCPDMTTRTPLVKSGDSFEIEIPGKDFAIISLEGK